jgi:hypothetical protein
VALAAVKRFGVSTKRTHLDSSSFCVQGEYLNSQPESNAVDILTFPVKSVSLSSTPQRGRAT